MSLMLSIYTQSAHQDVRMPADQNADLQVTLSRNQFRMERDLKLELENLDGSWKIKDSASYTVMKNDQIWADQPIDRGDILHIEANQTVFTILVLEQNKTIGSFDKFEAERLREFTVGSRDTRDVVYTLDKIVSRDHATIRVSGGSAYVQDESSNGTYVNGSRAYGTTPLNFGDEISIFGLKIVYLNDVVAMNTGECGAQLSERMMRCQLAPVSPEAPAKEHPEPESREELFHRSPRKIISLQTEPEEIEAPPQRQMSNQKPVWMIIGPSFTMTIPMMLGTGFMALARNMTGMAGSAFMYIGLVTAIASAIIGVSWAIINMNYSKKEEREAELLRLQKYGEYLMECADRIRRKYESNRRAMLDMYPDAHTCCGYWCSPQELWTRNRSHTDLLYCRLGLGDIPFQTPITVPKKRFSLNKDDLADRPMEIKQTYSVLSNVPIGVDLAEHRVVGLVGKDRADVARCIITQIAANNCYTDVRLAILCDGSTNVDFSFTKWLPHVWNGERSQRYVALNAGEVSGVCYELTQIFRVRAEAAAARAASRNTALPTQYVVVVESAQLLEEEPLAKYLYEDPAAIGVSTILLAPSAEQVPNTCDFIIESGNHFSGMYSMVPTGEKPRKIQFDYVSVLEAEEFARRISGIRVPELHTGGNLPDSLTFLEMMGVTCKEELNILDNWKKSRTYQTLQAMIGWKMGGQPCYLNIHEKFHGPHGLLAGTTGSGKSETLQTYLLSLAINYSPKDVGIFLIDYKGASMANLFSRLPHVLGAISNLSGNQIRRALVSINSERERRERIFSEFGVNHIDAYTKLVKSGEARQPVPHLFIVIDEFAQLKNNQKDFMKELITVAQVGRSLGIHLILACQKPFGTVDEDIQANTRFRLCLRVADKRDSQEVLGRPDAAYLTQAGRCYMQVGNDELYELFQSGWSGAPYDEEMSPAKSHYAVQLENSGKVIMTGNSNRVKKMLQRKLEWIAQLVACCHGANVQRSSRMTMIDGIYQNLREREIDYEDSDFNRKALNSFVEEYTRFFTMEPEKAAPLILADAERNGKKLPQLREKTQLEVIVEYLDELAQEGDWVCNLKLWMPELPGTLTLRELKGAQEQYIPDDRWNAPMQKDSLTTFVGMVDDPHNQKQFPLMVDFLHGGNLAVCGAVSTGKSVLMQTIAYGLIQSHTPDMVNLYMIDYSSKMLMAFADAPHVGGVIGEGETDKLDKLFLMLNRTIRQRRELFQGGSFLQYISTYGNKVPAIVVMLDGYAAFRDKTENAYESRLLELARDGAGQGIFLCISSGGFGTAEIQTKLAEMMRQVLTLEMDSKYSYSECLRTNNFEVLPEAGIPGRGLAIVGSDVLEYQTALALPGSDFARNDAIKERCAQIAGLWKGSCAAPIPRIPKDPTWSQFTALEEYQHLVRTDRFLPLGYCQVDATVFSLDLSKTYCYHISGRERSGKSGFLRNVALAAKDRGARIFLIDKRGQETERRTAELCGAVYVNSDEAFLPFVNEINNTINLRHKLHKSLTAQEAEPEEIFEAMRPYQQIFVLIADLQDFIQFIASVEKQGKPGEGAQRGTPIADRLCNIIAKGALHQVYFFGVSQLQDQPLLAMQKLYQSFIQDKNGIHLGGEMNKQKLLPVGNLSYAEQTKALNAGIGYVNDLHDSARVQQVVIPANKGRKK